MAIFDPYQYDKCDTCGNTYTKYHKCEYCAKLQRLQGIVCPCCKSKEIEEGSVNQDNGICGPGFSSWNIFPHLFCLDCGVIFKNLKTK